MPKRQVHPSITEARVLAAVQNQGTDNPGFCIDCGADADGCEPDARNYRCEVCGRRYVFGAEEVLLMGAYHRGGGGDGAKDGAR